MAVCSTPIFPCRRRSSTRPSAVRYGLSASSSSGGTYTAVVSGPPGAALATGGEDDVVAAAFAAFAVAWGANALAAVAARSADVGGVRSPVGPGNAGGGACFTGGDRSFSRLLSSRRFGSSRSDSSRLGAGLAATGTGAGAGVGAGVDAGAGAAPCSLRGLAIYPPFPARAALCAALNARIFRCASLRSSREVNSPLLPAGANVGAGASASSTVASRLSACAAPVRLT